MRICELNICGMTSRNYRNPHLDRDLKKDELLGQYINIHVHCMKSNSLFKYQVQNHHVSHWLDRLGHSSSCNKCDISI